MRKKLHYWMQGRIQKYTRFKAMAHGIRYSRVLARGTSLNAFDGSGEVVRKGNCAVAVFPTGKVYNADLNASYNIGAQYWIRYFASTKKAVPENGKVAGRDGSSLPADRHRQTLASLISLARLSRSVGIPLGQRRIQVRVFLPTGKPPL